MIKKILIIVGMAICIGIFLVAGRMEQSYTMEGTVINENIVKDNTGNMWEMDYIPYRDGANVKIYFSTNDTFTREDDIITKIILKSN